MFKKKLSNLLKTNPFDMDFENKENLFINYLKKLTNYHYKKCSNYRKILDIEDYKFNSVNDIKNLPFLPVRIFKEIELKSISNKDVAKTLVSSGTSGKLSKIFLDRYNSEIQTKVLHSIVSEILGNKRLPMLIIDKKPNNFKESFNARIAAFYGFSIFGKEYTFLLNEKNEIDYDLLNNFIKKNKNKKFLIFGFTSIIYNKLINELNTDINFSTFKNSILLHGGGWKKMEEIKVTNLIFKKELKKKFSISKVHNYYGMIEQTGSIFIECQCGFFVASKYSDIMIRGKDFKLLDIGKKGYIQLISLLPISYPGHNLLTEDIGEIVSDRRCNCNMLGKKFLVHGRIKEAEIRGCSDI